MLGYHKKILRVDLTSRKIEVQDLDDSLLEKYVGGVGLGARLLYDETTRDTDPLGPENILAAMTGPFTDSRVPSSSRHHVMGLSPLTGILGESNVGGSWAVHFKKTGYDGIVVTGKAETPVYLWIHDGGVEIRDARPIVGKDSIESADWLKGQTTDKASAAVIGPAGERMARIAGIPHVGTIVRQAARCGMGAVMGSKNLKAMVTFGTRKVMQADEDGLKEQMKTVLPHIRKVTETFGKYGTSGGVENYEKLGNFPLQNWRASRWADAVKISGVTMHDTILKGRYACLQCPIACGRHIRIEDGPYGPIDGEGPEYETIGTMGGECLISDLAAICKANDLCNRFGLDTMSTGSVIAFAMEAFEKGLITTADTDGIELRWGSGEALVEMTKKIGLRQGIGELMGEGVMRMARALGRNAVEFAIHVKGLEPSAHDPRRFWSQALSYGTAARGACHNASWSHPYELALSMSEIGIDKPHPSCQVEGTAVMTANLQNYQTMNDALILCRFAQVGKAVTATNVVDWYNMITGRQVDIGELMTIGERIFNLKRLFNTRLGISRKDDFLPPRFLTHNRKGEGITTQLPPMGKLLADYYDYRGWSEDGLPTHEKLRQLGI
ncbi:MAG: aldehyde ferredoxin oxidoreductase family protein [Deltaproteobacteria bacterium]